MRQFPGGGGGKEQHQLSSIYTPGVRYQVFSDLCFCKLSYFFASCVQETVKPTATSTQPPTPSSSYLHMHLLKPKIWFSPRWIWELPQVPGWEHLEQSLHPQRPRGPLRPEVGTLVRAIWILSHGNGPDPYLDSYEYVNGCCYMAWRCVMILGNQ